MKLKEIMHTKFLGNKQEKQTEMQTTTNKPHSNDKAKTSFKSTIPHHVLHQNIKFINQPLQQESK